MSHYNYEELDEIVNKNVTKQEFLDVLSTSRNKTVLEDLWSSWQFALLYGEPYKPILQLTSKAAKLNGKRVTERYSFPKNNKYSKLNLISFVRCLLGYYNVKEYWEKLVEYEEAYKRAEELWSTIEPLYNKLHSFALNRLNAYYKTNYTYIPTYLTGKLYDDVKR